MIKLYDSGWFKMYIYIYIYIYVLAVPGHASLWLSVAEFPYSSRVQRPKLDLLTGIILMNRRWSKKEGRFYLLSQFFG
jgi:hypothetical protein